MFPKAQYLIDKAETNSPLIFGDNKKSLMKFKKMLDFTYVAGHVFLVQ